MKIKSIAVGLFLLLLLFGMPLSSNATLWPSSGIQLSVVPTNGGVVLTVTTPTPTNGSLTYLDVRYNTNPLNPRNWLTSPQVLNLTHSFGTPGQFMTYVTTGGFTPGATYYFGVRYQDSSNSWSVISDQKPPSVVAGGSTYSQQVNWPPSPDVTAAGYWLLSGTASGSYTTTNVVGNVSSFTVNGLLYGQTYYWAVVTTNASGDQVISPEIFGKKP